MNRFVIFDLDDTLVDSTGAIDAWFVELATRRGLGPDGLAFLRAEQQRPVPPAESFRAIVEHFGFSDTPQGLRHEFETRLPQLAKPFAGVRAGLRALRRSGWRIALLTNGLESQQRDKIRGGLRELFDHCCFTEDEGTRKPDPEVFRLAARRAGAELDGAWMVGDSLENDIAGGAAVGMSTIWVCGQNPLPHNGTRPDATVATVAGAFGILAAAAGAATVDGNH